MKYKIISVFSLSLIPILIYLSYSYLLTGVFLDSSYCRSISLENSFINNPNGLYSAYYHILIDPTVLMGILLISYAILKEFFMNNLKKSWLIFLFLTSLICYIFIFTIYAPISSWQDIQRYYIPVIPFAVVLISLAIFKIISFKSTKIIKTTIISIIIIFLVIIPPLTFFPDNEEVYLQPLTFNEVTEKSAVTYLNNIAEPNSTVLAYEVQDRYYLRPDLKILSLDGISDGKITPFLAKRNITGFLWEYKPNYWIANQAVDLPIYSNSILGEVINATGGKEGSSITIDDITFKNIKTRTGYDNPMFWGYTNIYELNYN